MMTSRPTAAAMRGMPFCAIKSKSRTYCGRGAMLNDVGWACR